MESIKGACFPLTAAHDGVGVALNQITKIRTADGREVAIVDWTWRAQFSTIDTLTGWTDLELRAFTYSEGDPITVSSNMTVRETATLMHTNISSPAEMDAVEEMLVYSIQVELYQMAEDTDTSVIAATLSINSPWNITRLHQQCIGELEVSQKAYQQMSIGWFAAGFGVYGFGLDNTAALQISTANNGLPSREAVDMFPVPVHIGGTEKYAFLLHNPTGRAVTYTNISGVEVAGQVMRLRCNLHGLHKRPSG